MKFDFSLMIISVVAAIAGSIVIVVCQPLYNELLNGPTEGVLQVIIREPTDFGADAKVYQDLSMHPMNLVIKHLDGPSIKGISVSLQSSSGFDHLEYITEGDASNISFSEDMRNIRIDIQELRKHSINVYRLIALDNSKVGWSAQMSEGSLFSGDNEPSGEAWYSHGYILVPSLSAILLIIIYISLKLIKKTYYGNISEAVRFKYYIPTAILIIAFSTIPILNALVTLFLFTSVIHLSSRISDIEQVEAVKEDVNGTKNNL